MAKSDSFFLRGIVTSNGSTYVQSEIDLGSYVNLGVSKSTLLRIHNISCQITDVDGVADSISGASACRIGHQLTTQSQTALVTADDKSLICSGAMQLYNAQIAEGTNVRRIRASSRLSSLFSIHFLLNAVCKESKL